MDITKLVEENEKLYFYTESITKKKITRAF